MPTYTFRNKKTGEIEEHNLKISKRQSFIDSNPNLEQVHLTMPGFGDLVRMGMKGPDDGLREVMSKINENVGSKRSNLRDKLSRN